LNDDGINHGALHSRFAAEIVSDAETMSGGNNGSEGKMSLAIRCWTWGVLAARAVGFCEEEGS
jgi:hypothetical protein